MDIAELVFLQKFGVFFVWKKSDNGSITTFLRNRANISLEVQIENAINDGRERMWTLVGIGNWYLRPINVIGAKQDETGFSGMSFEIYNVSASLLRLKKLPDRELRSTELGITEMREKWIPRVCALLRKALWESTE